MNLKARRFITILGFQLLVVACNNSTLTGPTVGLDEQFQLKQNETATIQDAGIKIHFASVPSDTRCPVEEICVSGQGDAIATIEVIPDGGSKESHDFHTSNLQPVTSGGYTIALVQLAPYPQTTDRIPQGDYRATLSVTK